MIKAAICDDNKTLIAELKNALLSYQTERERSFETVTFFSPDKLFDYMETEKIDLIFMDLEFGDKTLDGISWSEKIHARFPHALILILTAYETRYKEGYRVRAFRFMTKPILPKELYDNLDACFEELYLNEHITLLRLGILHKIPLKDILYLSAVTGGSEIWTANDTYYSDNSLLSWEERLPSAAFFRCHRTYIVNLRSIIRLSKNAAVLTNGSKIPVSRRKLTALRLAFMKNDVSS
ncbi:MAG: response regulator transcription factor [Lachnospiraceae bacterium]|nr:response regulator transcription factor [Lachnospiraceae bacterium]